MHLRKKYSTAHQKQHSLHSINGSTSSIPKSVGKGSELSQPHKPKRQSKRNWFMPKDNKTSPFKSVLGEKSTFIGQISESQFQNQYLVCNQDCLFPTSGMYNKRDTLYPTEEDKYNYEYLRQGKENQLNTFDHSQGNPSPGQLDRATFTTYEMGSFHRGAGYSNTTLQSTRKVNQLHNDVDCRSMDNKLKGSNIWKEDQKENVMILLNSRCSTVQGREQKKQMHKQRRLSNQEFKKAHEHKKQQHAKIMKNSTPPLIRLQKCENDETVVIKDLKDFIQKELTRIMNNKTPDSAQDSNNKNMFNSPIEVNTDLGSSTIQQDNSKPQDSMSSPSESKLDSDPADSKNQLFGKKTLKHNLNWGLNVNEFHTKDQDQIRSHSQSQSNLQMDHDNFSKKQLLSYVSTLTTDLCNSRRQIQELMQQKIKSVSLTERGANQSSIDEIFRYHEKTLKNKNYVIFRKDQRITSINNLSKEVTAISRKNYMMFFQFYKDLIELEQSLKNSHSGGERNASYKIEKLIQKNAEFIMKLDENYEILNEVSQQISNINEENIKPEEIQEESLQEFEEEFKSGKKNVINTIDMNKKILISGIQEAIESRRISSTSRYLQQKERESKLEVTNDRNEVVKELCIQFGISSQKENEDLSLSQVVNKIKGKHDYELKKAFKSKNKMFEQLMSAQKHNLILEKVAEYQSLQKRSPQRESILENQFQENKENLNVNIYNSKDHENVQLLEQILKAFHESSNNSNMSLTPEDKEFIASLLVGKKKEDRGSYSLSDIHQLQVLLSQSLKVYNLISPYTLSKNSNFMTIKQNIQACLTLINKVLHQNNHQSVNDTEHDNAIQNALFNSQLSQMKSSSQVDLNDRSMDERVLKNELRKLQIEIEELQEKNTTLAREQELLTARRPKEHDYRSQGHGSKPPLRKSGVNKEFVTIFKPMSEKERHSIQSELEVQDFLQINHCLASCLEKMVE